MLISALLLGLFGSLHCAGMCGPIVMALPLQTTEKWMVALQAGIYHIGRIFTYSLMGAIVGTMGWGISLIGYQKILSITLGALLILSACFTIKSPTQLFNWSFFNRFITSVQKRLGKSLRIAGPLSAFKIGMLNGVLPCGLVYVALAGTVTYTSPQAGALHMLAFGTGTLPMMFGLMFFGGLYRNKIMRWKRFIPIGLALFGLFLIYRGFIVHVPSDVSVWQQNGFNMSCH